MNDFNYCISENFQSVMKLSYKLFAGTRKYGISYRDLEEMMLERGVEVDHRILYGWVQKYAPEIQKCLRW